jgi:hypothetical protein
MPPTQRHRTAAERLAEATGEEAETFAPDESIPVPDPDELETVAAETRD